VRLGGPACGNSGVRLRRLKGRGAALWASRGRNRNTSASSAAARSLTSSLDSAPSSVTTAGTTKVSTPSLLAQTRSTRRPAASGEDEEGHGSRRADWRRCQQCSTTCRRSPRKLLAAVVTRVLGPPRDRKPGLTPPHDLPVERRRVFRQARRCKASTMYGFCNRWASNPPHARLPCRQSLCVSIARPTKGVRT
jgi:hypothetical protein